MKTSLVIAAFLLTICGALSVAAQVPPMSEAGTLRYWRKAFELQPNDVSVGREVARRLAARGRHQEAVEIYDRLIKKDPDRALAATHELKTIYEEHLPDLTERMLAWSPSAEAMRFSPGAGDSFLTVAFACEKSGQFEQAAALCRRCIEAERNKGERRPSLNLTHALLRCCLKAGQRQAARDALVDYYLPRPLSEDPRRAYPQNQADWFYYDHGLQEIAGLSPLNLARPAGLLPDLKTALEASRAADPDAFAEQQLAWVLAITRLDMHDPDILPELPALLAAAATSSKDRWDSQHAGLTVRIVIARRLQAWPGHEDLAVMALREAHSLAKTPSDRSDAVQTARQVGLWQAIAELQASDPAAATATIRALALPLEATDTRVRHLYGGDYQEWMDLLLRAGPEGDALFEELHGYAGDVIGNYDQFARAAYDVEMAQRHGQNQRLNARAWLLDEGAGEPGAPSTVVYELSVPWPERSPGRPSGPTSRGRSTPGAERGRTLLLSHGDDPEHLTPIGQLQTTRTFGTWVGQVPPGHGYLRVAVDAASENEVPSKAAASPAWESDSVEVLRAPNLVVNPDFAGLKDRRSDSDTFSIPGWSNLLAGFWKHEVQDSPRPGRPFVHVELPFSPTYHTIVGTRIPVEAGHAYFQGGWLRDKIGVGQPTRFGCRFLDAKGNLLKEGNYGDLGTRNWRWHALRFEPAGNTDAYYTIPAGTAFIEPTLSFDVTADWTGLYLGKID